MSKLLPLATVATTAFLLIACETQAPEADQVAQMSQCEKVRALINAHPNKFEKLRTNPKPSNKITIWDARYHLVGKNCQVWGWGQGKTDYMCSLTAPNQQIAMDNYNRAKSATQACLGNDWQLQEMPRKLGEGVKAVFSHPGSETVVAVHAVETNGLRNDEWTAYFFVGDASDEL